MNRQSASPVVEKSRNCNSTTTKSRTIKPPTNAILTSLLNRKTKSSGMQGRRSGDAKIRPV